MTREMTPKDALRRISGFISFCCYEYFDKELEKDWKKDIDAITQALDRLELLEKENQELKEKISKFEKPILYMCRDRRSRELERLRLLELVNTYNVPILLNDFETVKELEKLKKVIEILKDKANIRLHILTNTDGSKIYEIEFILGYYSTIHEITQQEYDLLKEFLENV